MSTRITPDTVIAKKLIAGRKILRADRIDAINSYFFTAVRLVATVVCLAVGFVELASPQIIPAEVNPFWAFAVALVISGGRKGAVILRSISTELGRKAGEEKDS